MKALTKITAVLLTTFTLGLTSTVGFAHENTTKQNTKVVFVYTGHKHGARHYCARRCDSWSGMKFRTHRACFRSCMNTISYRR